MHVDVFERRILDQLAVAAYSSAIAARPSSIAAASSAEMMPCCAEHRGMGAAGGDVLAPQAACRSRSRHLSRASRGRAARKAPAPHLIGVACAADRCCSSSLLALAGCDRQKAEAPQAPALRRRRGRRPRASTAATRARPRPTVDVRRSRRRRHQPRRLQGRAGAGQSVGELVRAVHQGIADARDARRRARQTANWA